MSDSEEVRPVKATKLQAGEIPFLDPRLLGSNVQLTESDLNAIREDILTKRLFTPRAVAISWGLDGHKASALYRKWGQR